MSKNYFYDVLVGQVATEKATMLEGQSEYCFYVHPSANKKAIKLAVESCFGVEVSRVTTLILKGKKKSNRKTIGVRKDRKKAFVRLKSGQVIDFEND